MEGVFLWQNRVAYSTDTKNKAVEMKITGIYQQNVMRGVKH